MKEQIFNFIEIALKNKINQIGLYNNQFNLKIKIYEEALFTFNDFTGGIINSIIAGLAK